MTREVLRLGTATEFVRFERRDDGNFNVMVREKACPERKNKPTHCERIISRGEMHRLISWLDS
jgi:hypothetical protein